MTSAIKKTLLPPGTPKWVTPELLANTIDVWQPYHKEILTPEAALTILLRMGGVLSILAEDGS